MSKITFDVTNPGQISDGFHTFDELYSHRIILFISLMKCNKSISWKSRLHDDGSSFDGWFISGMNLKQGTITYHIPERFWDMLSDVETLDVAPKFDGHTSDDVIKRLKQWAETL